MYGRKNRNWKNKRKRNREAGFLQPVLLVALTVFICTYVEMVALAAPVSSAPILAEEKTKETLQMSWKLEAAENMLAVQNLMWDKIRRQEGPMIVVDAGHGGEDSGCLGFGIYEKDINLQIALKVKQNLEERGFRVLMTRETDEFLSKEERAELANSYQADAYVSIHQNTYEGSDKSVSGIETWYDGADQSRDNARLAELVHQQTIKSTGANERVLWDIADLYVTNKTLMPACLIETGFLTNRKECRQLSTAEYQEKIAEGIAEGIEMYFYAKTSA